MNKTDKAHEMGLLDVCADGNAELAADILRLVNGHPLENGLSALCVAITGVVSQLPVEDRNACMETIVTTLGVLETISMKADELGIDLHGAPKNH